MFLITYKKNDLIKEDRQVVGAREDISEKAEHA